MRQYDDNYLKKQDAKLSSGVQPFEREPHTLKTSIEAHLNYNSRFSRSENEFMKFFRATDYKRKETARAMFISVRAVDQYIDHLKDKFQVNS